MRLNDSIELFMPNYFIRLIIFFIFIFPLGANANYISIADIQLAQVKPIFTQAESIGAVESAIQARAVYANTGKLIGYIALSHEIKPIPGYSGRPISALIGVNTSAEIAGVNIIHHEEPILVIGVKTNDIQQFIAQYTGIGAKLKTTMSSQQREGYVHIDGITGATITAMILNKSIMISANKVTQQLLVPELFSTDNEQLSESEQHAVWEHAWQDKKIHIVIIITALGVLLFILFFQDWLVIHPRLYNNIHLAFLVFTVVYIGIWHLAQLSIVNVLTFVRSLSAGFSWETLLIDPVIFILWGFVACSIILWGRGVFCGWLCPFGALQELIHKVAERFNFPELEFPQMVHERLLAIKYFILIVLAGLSLESLILASHFAEVEPFKTTFIFKFQRDPPYLLYAITLLVIAAFNSKFYCKYLCPLGAALSFITRFRVFDWLRRRKECGRPCQACSAVCQSRAIKPTGEIIATECHYCLECQVTYWDEHRCPPLVDKHHKKIKKHNEVINKTLVSNESTTLKWKTAESKNEVEHGSLQKKMHGENSNEKN